MHDGVTIGNNLESCRQQNQEGLEKPTAKANWPTYEIPYGQPPVAQPCDSLGAGGRDRKVRSDSAPFSKGSR